MEDVIELGGEDGMGDEMGIILSGLLYPDRVTDEDFTSAVLGGDLLGSSGIVPDATSEVGIERWRGEDGYVSATVSPAPGSLPVRDIDSDTGEIAGGEGDLWRSGLHKNGAIRIESTLHRTMMPDSEMLGGEDMPDMLGALLEVDFYMEIISPYPISETNGTVTGGRGWQCGYMGMEPRRCGLAPRGFLYGDGTTRWVLSYLVDSGGRLGVGAGWVSSLEKDPFHEV